MEVQPCGVCTTTKDAVCLHYTASIISYGIENCTYMRDCNLLSVPASAFVSVSVPVPV